MTTQTEDPPDRQVPSARRQEIFERFFRDHHASAIGYGIRRGLDEADAREIAADALRLVWEKCPTPDDSALPFLYGTCRNLLMHARRERQRRSQAETRARHDLAFEAARAGTAGQDLAVRAAVESLGDPGGEIIRLIYWDGLPAAQVASIMNSTEQAIWAHASRARRKLAHLLKGNRHEF